MRLISTSHIDLISRKKENDEKWMSLKDISSGRSCRINIINSICVFLTDNYLQPAECRRVVSAKSNHWNKFIFTIFHNKFLHVKSIWVYLLSVSWHWPWQWRERRGRRERYSWAKWWANQFCSIESVRKSKLERFKCEFNASTFSFE